MALERMDEKGWRVRLRYGSGQRTRLWLPATLNATVAQQRETRLSIMAAMLARAGRPKQGLLLLKRAAEQLDDRAFSTVEEVARELCDEVAVDASRPRPVKHQTTFREVGEMWLSGQLHERWPDVVRRPSERTTSKYRAALHLVYGEIGKIPVAKISLDDAERAKAAAIPYGTSTRWFYSMLIRRVMALAEYPLRMIDRNPIPPKFVASMPKVGAFSFLYPEEDAALLSCARIPLLERTLYGLLSREGFRISEALSLRWHDIDVARGVVRLDKNKTRSPRSWVLSAGVVESLDARRADIDSDSLIFAELGQAHPATRFREHLQAAGVTRSELFKRTAERRPIRIHDLRGTFVTLALATGKSESWVMDRTGHTTSAMLGRYRRPARHAAEIGLGELLRLDEALGLRGPTETAEVARQASVPTGADPVTSALAKALEKATAAGEWQAVRELAREIGERRKALEPLHR